ncbi:MAG: ComEC/Rec2 family competence protein [Paludibacteraceae bacterium]|nr:ComEC/Rec2 family competence protein [Paludibacteraceae bacterium]
MRDWLRTHPMWVLLIPLIGGLLLCRFYQWPVSLQSDTEFAYLDSTHIYRTVVRDYPSPRRRTQRVEAELLSLEDSLTIPLHRRVYLYVATDSAGRAAGLRMGDTLLVRTQVRRGGMLGRFRYGDYLRMQGLVGTAYVPAHAWLRIGQNEKKWHPRAWQHGLSQRLRQMRFAPRELGTLEALTLGYKEDIDPDVKRSFQTSGAAHVLAVSGLHTGIVYMVLWLLLTGFGRWKPLYEETRRRVALSLLVIAGLWGYALLTGMTASVVRSALMLTIVQIGYMCRRNAVSMNTLATAAFILLLLRTRDLFSVGFQLSFAAVGAILLLVPLMQSYLPRRVSRREWINSAWRYVATGLIVVSVAAWLGTMPLMTYYYGYVSNYFLLTNLIVLPLASVAVTGGFLCLLLGTVPVLGTAICRLTEGVIWIMNSTTGWIESLPGSQTALHISPLMVVLLYSAIVCGALALQRKLWWAIPCAACLAGFCYEYTIV